MPAPMALGCACLLGNAAADWLRAAGGRGASNGPDAACRRVGSGKEGSADGTGLQPWSQERPGDTVVAGVGTCRGQAVRRAKTSRCSPTQQLPAEQIWLGWKQSGDVRCGGTLPPCLWEGRVCWPESFLGSGSVWGEAPRKVFPGKQMKMSLLPKINVLGFSL